MPKGQSNNITNISGKLRNNTLMYGRVMNGRQFISTVKKGWDNVPSLEQMCLRIRWRYFQQIWPVFWDWLQGADFFIEKYGTKAKELFLYYEDSENAGYFKSNAFKPQLRLDWEYNPGDYGVADYTEDNPPDGGLLQWWYDTQSEAGITIFGAVKYYRTFKMLAKGYLWHVFINRANYLRIPVGYKDPETGKIVITGYKISQEGAWLFKKLGITYYEQTGEGYKQLIKDITKANFLVKSDDEGGIVTPPSEGGEGGEDTPPGGGGGSPENPDSPEDPDSPEVVDRKINEFLVSADWLIGDGSRYVGAFRPISASNTYTSADVTIKAKIKVHNLGYNVGTVINICGSSISSDGIRYRKTNIALRVLSSSTFEVGYFSAVANVAEELKFYGVFNVGDTLSIEGNDNTLSINGQSYTIGNANNYSLKLVDLVVLYAGSSNGGRAFAGQLASLQYWAKGTCYSSLIPSVVTAELPASMVNTATAQAVGSVGLWDEKNQRFLTSAAANTWKAINDTN